MSRTTNLLFLEHTQYTQYVFLPTIFCHFLRSKNPLALIMVFSRKLYLVCIYGRGSSEVLFKVIEKKKEKPKVLHKTSFQQLFFFTLMCRYLIEQYNQSILRIDKI